MNTDNGWAVREVEGEGGGNKNMLSHDDVQVCVKEDKRIRVP